MSSRSESLSVRAWRFVRATIVGGGATLADFSIFTTCVRLADVAPAAARVPALMVGACVQFFGNRTFTFRARAGSLSRQAKWFLLFESIGLGLNLLLFRLLLSLLGFLPAEAVTFIASFAVFVGFNYPLRRLVIFKVPSERS
ncbi:MAG TPA: GtrA family protein [Polyangiaceae bacterium]|nr:GtrA family protein [Polyangiaceae bacterium]